MTVTRRPAKNFISLLLLGCLLTSFPGLSKAQNDEQANVWRVVESFFAAFAQKDVEKVLALWSVKSPEFPKNRGITLHTFAVNNAIAVKSLRQEKITVEKDRATVELTAELIVTSTQPNSSPKPLQSRRTIQLINESGSWKLWKNTSAEDELVAAIAAVKTRKEADALLKVQPELETPDLIVAFQILTRELLSRGKHAEASMIGDLALSERARRRASPRL